LLYHAWSLGDGTVLDDHWHQQGLREHGWSLSELMRTLAIEPAQGLHLWWQDQTVRWEYGRPLFILIMKVVYHVLGGDRPVALHALSIALHLASVWMVYLLAARVTRSTRWSLVAALLFAIYPHTIITVAWPSSQNIVIATSLMLAAILAYLRGTSLDITATSRPDDSQSAARNIAPARPGWMLIMFMCWIAALMTRENALMVPVILAAFDALAGGPRRLRARAGIYGLFLILGIAFIAWRLTAVTHPMPDVYVRRPDGDWPAYLAWSAAKLLHYVTCSIWPAALVVGPTGRIHPWTDAPGDSLLMLGIVVGVGCLYASLNRGRRGWWIWPLWILLAVLPVVPIIATPHSGYLGGVGFAIGAVLAAGRLQQADRSHIARLARAVPIVYLAVFAIFSFFHRLQWSGAIASERYTYAWIAADPPPPKTTDVFFINLPFVNIYAKPALDRQLGPSFHDVRLHALTFAPQPLKMASPCIVRQQDAHTLYIEIAEQPWFSRLLGRFVLEGFRRDGTFRVGQVIDADTFSARVDAIDDDGLRALTFTFNRPLCDPTACFYLSTPHCGAVRLRFPLPDVPPRETTDVATGDASLAALITRMEQGDARAGAQLLARLATQPAAVDPAIAARMRAMVAFVAGALGDPVQLLLKNSGHAHADWHRVLNWWQSRVDDDLLQRTWVRRCALSHYDDALAEINNARGWVSYVVRTDLYLTGPPFPGPFGARSASPDDAAN